MKNESVKKSLEKSKYVLENRKIVKQKICIKKTHTFTIIDMNFVQEQLIRTHMHRLKSIEGEETLKTENSEKLTHLKKNHLKNRQIVQTPISHST